MNKVEAVKATRNGAIAAIISAVITVVVVLIAMNADADGKLAIWNDPSNFLDVLLVVACAYGMYRKSRGAAVIIFIYFIVSKIIIALETQIYSGFGTALLFLYFYGKAIQGSFVYHRLEKNDNPDYKPASKLSYILGIPSSLLVTVLIGYSLMSTTGVVPSTRVQSANEINTNDIAVLIDNGIVPEDEKVEYFYSQGLSSILESGNVLTNGRVILYLTDENSELQVYQIPLNEVTDVSMESQGDTFNESVYKVSTENPDQWLKLFLSAEQKGDRKFVKALQTRMTQL